MRKVHPPQLIEALISHHDMLQDLQEISLNVKKFNQLAKQMPSIDYQLDFSYQDLLDFASRFHGGLLIIGEVELHLHFSEELVNRLSWYNQMYSGLFEPSRIFDLWKKLGD